MASKFTITAELNLQTKNLGQVVNNLKRQFQGVDLNIKIKDIAKAESQLRNVSNEAKSASQSIGILGSSLGTAFKKFTAITLATGTIVGFTRAIKNAVGDAIEFEREVVKIAQATGKTTDQLKGLTSEISSVASNFGVSSKELILAARSLTQAGFAADKVTGALKLLAQTELAATFDSIGDTTEGVIALLNQFGQAAQKSGNEITFLEKSLSAINQVSKDFAVESSDLITAIRTTGSAFESAGGNLNELLALFTSVRATTRESAESIATGFRTIFTRVQRLDTINNLRALGVELQDVEGKFIGPMEATKRLSIVLNSIDPKDFRFNMIVEELGGFRQVSKVIPLIQQFATTQKALNVAQGASGSLAKDAATAQQALAVQISKTREKFSTFIRDMSDSSSFQGTVKTLLSMAEAFLRVADTIKPLIPLLASFAAFKIGSALIPAFRSLGSNKKAEGGRIHAFARGGLVPGQGNGDTVPAMLTPGEFVIKKSSVNKLGIDNLAKANKYGIGTTGTGVKATPRPAKRRATVTSVVNSEETRKKDSPIDYQGDPYQEGDKYTRKLVSDQVLSDYVEASDKPSIKLSREKINLKNNEMQSILSQSYGIPKTFKIFGNGEAYSVYGRQTKEAVTSGKSDIYRNFEKAVLARAGIVARGWKENNSTNMSDEVDAIKENKKGNILEIGDMKFTEDEVDKKDLLAKAAKWMAKIDIKNEKATPQKPRQYFKENVQSLIDEPQINFTVFEPPLQGPKKPTKNNLLTAAGYPKDTSGAMYNSSPLDEYVFDPTNPIEAYKLQNPKQYFAPVSSLSSKPKDAELDKRIKQLNDQYDDKQKLNSGGFVKLYPAKPNPSRKSTYQGVEINENMWDASFDVADPKAYDYFVRSIQGPDSQKPSLKKYAEKQGKTYEQLFNLLQTQNAQWFEDRVHDEIGGILAGGNNYYVDILDANKTVMGDVDVKDTKKRESSSEFAAKAYNHARWKFANKIGPDPKTLKELSISSVTTHPNDPIFKESLKQAAQNLTVNKPKAGTQEKLQALGLSTPTTTELGQVITGATFKDRATEYQGYRLANLTEKGEMPQTSAIATNKAAQNATGLLASVLYDKLIQKYKDEGDKTKIDVGAADAVSLLKDRNLSPIFNTILGTGPKNKVGKNSILTEQQVKAINDAFKARMGFASGGAAEGTDTVPAMLTPGEYVINKKSAQAIGYGNLNRMNKVGKFANGGEVQYLSKGGVAGNNNSEFSDIFSKYNDDELHHIFVKTALLSPNFSDSLTQYRELNLLPKPDSSQRGNSLKTMIEGYGLSKLSDKQLEAKYKNRFEITDDIKNAFKYYDRGIVDLISSFKKEDKTKIGEMTNVDLKKDKNFGKIEVHTGKNAISARYIGDENDRTGFITAVKAKGDDDFYRTKFSYATSGYGLKLYETLLSEVAKAGSWMAPDNADISNEAANLWKRYYTRSDVDKNLLSYSNWNNKTGKFKTTPLKDIEQLKSTWPSKKDPDWALQYKYRKSSNADDTNIVRSKRNFGPSYEGQEAVISAFYETPTRLAVGGNVPGEGNQDTVPALLTPGEYVINKKSAQAIGYGALNSMNKVGKFAQGGVVQGFATGGEVDKKFLQKTGYQGGSMGPMTPAQKAYDAELVKAAKYIKLMGNAQLETSEVYKSLVAQAKSQGAAFKLTNQQVKEYGDAIKTAKKIQQLQKSSVNAQSAIDNRDPNKYKDMFKNAIDNSKQLSQNFVLVSGTITSVIGQMSGLDKATGDAITAFSTTFTAFYTIGQEFIDIAQDVVISQQAKRLESASMKAHRSVIDSNKAAIQKHTAAINQATNSLLKIKDPEKDITDNGKEQALVEKRAARLQKVMQVLNGGLVGFSVALAAGNAAIAYLSAKAQESADILAKSVEKFKESADNLVTGERLGAEFKKAFLESGMVDALNKGVNSASGYQTIGASALGGAAVGSILGPIGAMLGGTIGAGAGLWKVVTESNEKFAQQQDSITKVASSMSSALYTSVTALQKFNKFILDIEKKSTGDVQKQAVSLTDAYASSTRDLINAQIELIRTYGGVAKSPELFKQYLDSLGTSISELNKAIDTVVGNLLSRTAKEIEGIVSGGGDPAKAQEEALKKFQEVSTKRNAATVDATYLPKIEEQARAEARLKIFNEGGDINDAEAVKTRAETIAKEKKATLTPSLNELKAVKNQVDTLGFQKSLKEIELQSLQSTKIMRQERDARNAVVGSLIKELALTVALQNFNYSLEKINGTISNIDAAFSGVVSGLRSSIPDIRVLDLLKPTGKNLRDFNIALNRIRSIDTAGGPGIGNGIADSLNDVRKAALGLEIALTDAGDKLQNMDPKQVENFVGKLLGGNANGVVGKTLQKILNDAIKPSEGQVAAGRGVGTQEGRQKVIDQFKKFAEDLSEKGKGIIKALSDAEKQQQEIYNKINESRKRQLDLQLEDVDSYERYISAVSRARGRDLTLSEKNSLRMEKQFRMVGGLAGNVDGIGKTLLAARRGLLESTDPAQQAKYADTANRTEQALKALANQAERTSDTLAEIEKIKAQRESVRDLAKEFAIGTKEERANLQKDLQGAMSVAKSGSFESLPEDQRKGASAILERFKDLPIFNGMTGRQAQNKAIAGSVRAAGGNEEIARMIEQDTSTPEEKLINELRSIYQQEAKAKEYLYKQENVMQTALIQALHENAMETARLSQSLASEFVNMQNQQALGGKAPTEADLNARIAAVQGELTVLTTNLENANKKLGAIIARINEQLATLNLTPFQEAIGFVVASINKMKGAFDSLVTWIETMTGRKLVGEAAPAAPKAKGGIIFRSKGGDTSAGINWQPKGTDTIPAMLTEGEFVVNAKETKKNRGLLEKINSGNYASMGGVIYRASGGIVAQKPDFAKPPWIDMPSNSATDTAKFDAARRYAIAKKSELEDAHNQSSLSNIYSFDQTPLYREFINIPFSTGKNSFISLADLLKGNFKSITEMSQDASTKPVDVTGVGKGAKGGANALKREELDKEEADKLSYIFEAQGPITSFSAGLARGMMGVPFASLIEFYLNSSRSLTKMAGINSLDDFMSAAGNERVPLLNQPLGAALKSLRNANLYDSIIGRLAPTLAGATSDENSPYAGAHSWGKDLGEIMNIGEWATGAGPITSAGKLFKIGSKYPKLAKILKLTKFGKKGLEYAGKAITAPLQGMLYFPINTILNKIIKNKKAQQLAQKATVGGGNKVSSVIENITEVALRESGEKAGTLGVDIPKLQTMIAEFVKRGDLEKVVTPEGVASTFLKGFNPKTGFGKYKIAQVLLLARRKKQEQDKPKVEDKKPPEPPKVNGAGGGAGGGAGAGAGAGPDTNRVGGGLSITEWMGQEQPNENENIPGGMTLEEYQQYQQDLARRQAERDAYDEAKKKQQPRKGGGSYSPSYEHDWKFVNPATVNPDGSDVGPNMDGDGMGGRGDGGNGGVIGGGGRGGNGGGGAGGMGGGNENPNANNNRGGGGGGGGGFEQPIIYSPYRSARSKMQAKVIDRMVRRGELNENQAWIAKFGRFYYTPYETASAKGGAYWKLWSDIQKAGESKGIPKDMPANYKLYYNKGGNVPSYFSDGGSVGGSQTISKNDDSGVDWTPKGTDKIRAMLSEGEFVVNADATKKNRGLLEQINSGKVDQTKKASRGGVIYRESGGIAANYSSKPVTGTPLSDYIPKSFDDFVQGFLSARSGGLGASNDTLEAIRSAGIGLGDSTRWIADIPAMAADLTARQFGVEGNYAGQVVDSLVKGMFGSNPQNQAGHIFGKAVGYGVQGMAGAATKGLAAKGFIFEAGTSAVSDSLRAGQYDKLANIFDLGLMGYNAKNLYSNIQHIRDYGKKYELPSESISDPKLWKMIVNQSKYSSNEQLADHANAVANMLGYPRKYLPLSKEYKQADDLMKRIGYDAEDLANGFIQNMDIHGVETQTPLSSVTRQLLKEDLQKKKDQLAELFKQNPGLEESSRSRHVTVGVEEKSFIDPKTLKKVTPLGSHVNEKQMGGMGSGIVVSPRNFNQGQTLIHEVVHSLIASIRKDIGMAKSNKKMGDIINSPTGKKMLDLLDKSGGYTSEDITTLPGYYGKTSSNYEEYFTSTIMEILKNDVKAPSVLERLFPTFYSLYSRYSPTLKDTLNDRKIQGLIDAEAGPQAIDFLKKNNPANKAPGSEFKFDPFGDTPPPLPFDPYGSTPPPLPPQKKSMGGVIYRSKGGDANMQGINWQPKGTDTIPAMLTEGEFVVNAKQTKKNRGLLEKINSGNYASMGGVIYRQLGGMSSGQSFEEDMFPSAGIEGTGAKRTDSTYTDLFNNNYSTSPDLMDTGLPEMEMQRYQNDKYREQTGRSAPGDYYRPEAIPYNPGANLRRTYADEGSMSSTLENTYEKGILQSAQQVASPNAPSPLETAKATATESAAPSQSPEAKDKAWDDWFASQREVTANRLKYGTDYAPAPTPAATAPPAGVEGYAPDAPQHSEAYNKAYAGSGLEADDIASKMKADTDAATFNQNLQNHTFTAPLTPETDINAPRSPGSTVRYSARKARLAQEAHQAKMEQANGITAESKARAQDAYDAQMARQAEYDKQQEAIRQKAEQEKAARENEQFDLAVEGYSAPEERQADIQSQQDNKAKSDAVADYSKKLEDYNKKSWLERQVSSAPVDPREHKTDNGTSWAGRYVQARTGQLATQQTNEGTTTDKFIEGARSFTGQFSNSFASAVSPVVGAVTTTLGLTDAVAGTNTLDSVNNFIGGSGFQNKTAAGAGALSGTVAGAIVGKNPKGAAAGAVSLVDDVAKPIVGAGVEWAKREGLARGSEALRDSGYNTGADILDTVQMARAAKQTVQTGVSTVQQGRAVLKPKKPKTAPSESQGSIPPLPVTVPTPLPKATTPPPAATVPTPLPKATTPPPAATATMPPAAATAAQPVAPKVTPPVRPDTASKTDAAAIYKQSVAEKAAKQRAEQEARDKTYDDAVKIHQQSLAEKAAKQKTEQEARDKAGADASAIYKQSLAEKAARQKTEQDAKDKSYSDAVGINQQSKTDKSATESAKATEREKAYTDAVAKSKEPSVAPASTAPSPATVNDTRPASAGAAAKFEERKAQQAKDTARQNEIDAARARQKERMTKLYEERYGKNPTKAIAKEKEQQAQAAKALADQRAKEKADEQAQYEAKTKARKLRQAEADKAAAKPQTQQYKNDSPEGVREYQRQQAKRQETYKLYAHDRATRVSPTGDIDLNATGFPDIRMPHYMALDKRSIAPSRKGLSQKEFAPYQYQNGGMVQHFATGGLAKGKDTIPAMLAKGEFVMQKSAVDQQGVGAMQAINNGLVSPFMGASPTPVTGNAMPSSQPFQTASKPNASNFNKDTGDSFSSLNSVVKELTKNMQSLNDSMKNRNKKDSGWSKTTTALGFAAGGSVFKPKGTDTVPAMLSQGEYVIQKKAVDSIGTETLEAINRGHGGFIGKANYLARGGLPDDQIKELSSKNPIGNIRLPGAIMPNNNPAAKDKTSEGFALSRPGGSGIFGNNDSNLLGMNGGAYDSSFNAPQMQGMQPNIKTGVVSYQDMLMNMANMKLATGDNSFTSMGPVLNYSSDYMSPMDFYNNSLGAQHNALMADTQAANSSAYDRMDQAYQNNRNRAFGGGGGGRGGRPYRPSRKDRMTAAKQGMKLGPNWRPGGPKPGFFSLGGAVSYLAKGGLPDDQLKELSGKNPISNIRLPGAIVNKQNTTADTGSYGPNMGTSKSESTAYDFGIGIGPMGGGGLSLNDAYLDKNSPFSPLNANAFGQNKPNIKTGVVSYQDMLMNMANMKLATGDNSFTSMGPVLNYSSDYMSPMDFYNNSLGAQHNALMADTQAANSSAYDRMDQAYQNNRSRAFGGGGGGGGGGRGGRRRRRGRGRNMGMVGDFKAPNPNVMMASTGGFVSYLAKGGKPDDFMSGMYGVGGLSDVNSMIPTTPEAVKPMSDAFTNMPQMGQQPNLKTGVVSYEDMLMNMANMKLATGDNSFTSMGPVLNYSSDYMSPMDLYNSSLGAQHNALMADTQAANSDAYGRMDQAYQNNRSRAFGGGGGGGRGGRRRRRGGQNNIFNPAVHNTPVKAFGGAGLYDYMDFMNSHMGKGNRKSSPWPKEMSPVKFASGGSVSYLAKGGPSEDSIPAMLTPGEFVMSKESVGQHGMAFMNHLNKGGTIKGYASGGAVGEPIYRAAGGSTSGGGSSTVNLNVDIGSISNAISSSIQRAFGSIGSIINLDSLNSLAATFSNLVQTLNGVAASVGNMNMTHQVNIGGEVNVNGINAKNIAENIKMEVGNMIVQTVKDVLNRAANNTSKRDTEAI